MVRRTAGRGLLRRLGATLSEAGARAALRLGDPVQATQLAEMAIVREPLREPARLLFIEALAESGDLAGALRAFEELRRLFAEELGSDVSAEAISLHRVLLRRRTSPDQGAPAPGGFPATDTANASAGLSGEGGKISRAVVVNNSDGISRRR